MFPSYLEPIASEIAGFEEDCGLKRRLFARWIERGLKEHLVVWLLLEQGYPTHANAVGALPTLTDDRVPLYRNIVDQIGASVQADIGSVRSGRERVSLVGFASALIAIRRFDERAEMTDSLGGLAFITS